MPAAPVSRRDFLKAVGVTLGAVGIAAVIPPSWTNLEEPVQIASQTGSISTLQSGDRLLPIRLLNLEEVVGNGLAISNDGKEWVAQFVPGQFVGQVDAMQYSLLGQLRTHDLNGGYPIHVMSSDSLEIRVELEMTFK